MMNEQSMTEEKQDVSLRTRTMVHEDWAVVILGFLIIFVSVAGVVFPTPSFSWKDSNDLFQKVFTVDNLGYAAFQFILTYVIALVGAFITGKGVRAMSMGFPVVYLLTSVALVVAGNYTMRGLNLEAVIFSLSIGLIISNTLNIPQWLRDSLSTELFVKIGLVLLGTGIIFGDILKAGSLGLIQALIVVFTVWYFAFWLCKRLKIDDELSMMISSAVSICGVSAAIATAGAIKGDPKKLSYVISLVLVTAIPMMIVMPVIANHFHFPEEVTGAWLGGTIDTTGAVVASGTLVGETALKVSTIVKFSQNVLLGIAAFVISVYWTYAGRNNDQKMEKPTLGVIWERFPKFVLGFVAASLLFSFVVPTDTIALVKESMKSIQTLWFVLAFTSIGLETRVSDLFNSSGRKPLFGFLTAQLFNILVTLLIAFLLFG